MKKYLILLFIPVIFTVYSFVLKNAEGPNYNYGLADPSYVYLLNSLSLSQMEGVGHTDHPGTPLQVAGAAIVKIYFSYSHQKDDITEDVLYRPEEYLKVIDHTLILLNAAGLFFAGLIIFSAFKRLTVGLIFQTIPFISINVLEVFPLVKTENFAFFFMLIQISLIFKYAYDNNSESKKYYVILSGILCGFILAVKISFICILFLPLIVLPGIKQKAIFILLVLITFFISILPVLSNMEYFINWIGDLFIHNGRYGKGDSTIINSSEFINNIAKIIVNEKFFIVSFFSLALILSILILKKNSVINSINSKEVKLSVALFIAMGINILMVAKHYSSRYMFPALILAVPGIFMSLFLIYKIYLSKLNSAYYFTGVLVFLILFGAYTGRKQLARSNNLNLECLKIENFLNENYKDALSIHSAGTSSEISGLIFAYYYTPEYSRAKYKEIIQKRFSGINWYDIFNDKLINFSNNAEEYKLPASGDNILYRTTDEEKNNVFLNSFKKKYDLQNAALEEIYSNDNGEMIYKVVISH